MFDRTAYLDFIASKASAPQMQGFDRRGDYALFPHQEAALDFACARGKSAAFLDTGLGKSRIEAAFAAESQRETNRPVLILTPPAVARQMQRECNAAGVEATIARTPEDLTSGVNITNIERLHHFDVDVLGAVVLDESSILKNFSGAMKRMLVEAFAATPYRLAATATPSPNDHTEIGQHSEWLDVMAPPEMLTRWFITDQSMMGGYRLKGHAAQHFWAWVASWARAAALPSDLGGCDDGYVLPPLDERLHVVDSDLGAGAADGALLRAAPRGIQDFHAEKRRTAPARIAQAVELARGTDGPVIVWCETNDESAALAKAIPDSVEVTGAMTPDAKESALEAFTFGQRRVIVTKPKIAGFGLNWQHAAAHVFASISHSYERDYQAVRRSQRYGRKVPLIVHRVIAETEMPVWQNIQRKAADHDTMKAAMARAMREAMQPRRTREVYTCAPEITLPAFMKG